MQLQINIHIHPNIFILKLNKLFHTKEKLQSVGSQYFPLLHKKKLYKINKKYFTNTVS